MCLLFLPTLYNCSFVGCSFLNGSIDTEPFTDDELLEHNKFILPSGEEFPWNKSRLPEFVRPLHYTIQIHPNLTTLDVTGWVVIQFIVLKETDFIVFHSRNLRVIEKWVKEEVEDPHRVDPHNISRLLEYPPFQQVNTPPIVYHLKTVTIFKSIILFTLFSRCTLSSLKVASWFQRKTTL